MSKTSNRRSLKVSIVIATYGAEDWKLMTLDRALPSAKNQGAHEIVVGHNETATIAQVRNELAEKTEGEWLCFLDADDELAPGYLDAMQRCYERESRDDGSPLLLTPAVSYVRKGRPQPPRFLDRGITLKDDNFLVVGTLIERDLFMQVGGFSDYPHGFEDWSLWAKAWKVGARIVQVPGAVYRAFIDPQSKHRQGWRNRRWQVATHNRVRAELFPE